MNGKMLLKLNIVCMSNQSCLLNFLMRLVLLWNMKHMLREFINRYIVVYSDDILIYNKWLDEHINHLRQLLDILRKESLYANI
jgi:hypothetical protein